MKKGIDRPEKKDKHKKSLDRSIVKVKGKHGEFVQGRGFSFKELKEAGLSCGEVSKLRIPVDSRRKSLHAENVDTLTNLKERDA